MTDNEKAIAAEIIKAVEDLPPEQQKFVQIFAEGVAAASKEGENERDPRE